MPWSGPLFEGHVCSLGYAVADWLEAHTCHGPGDVQGEPLVLDREWLDFLVAAYRLDPQTGRRIVDEAVLSRPKGVGKSELAGLIAVAEALGPVRFNRWDDDGQPVGRRVRSPLIKVLATEETQTGNTFEVIAFVCGEWGREHHPDVYGGITGARQYQSATALYLPDGGEIRACTAGAASKDGGRETFVVADETHLYVLPELRSMFQTVHRNTVKRAGLGEPWLLQTTTSYRPGEQSIAEATLTAWRSGQFDEHVLVDHREAKGKVDLDAREHTIRQLRDVYGEKSEWMDLDRIYRAMRDLRVCPDVATAARYYLNRSMAGADGWLDIGIWDRQALDSVITPGEQIALGFDGSLRDDSTVLIGSRISDGFVFALGIWAKPTGPEAGWWEVPRGDVDATLDEAFHRYQVTRLYCDPHEWRSDIDRWAETHGEERVLVWDTHRDVRMSAALDRLRTDLVTGPLHHAGDPAMRQHVGNCYVRRRGSLRLVRKEHPQSPRKIDSVVGAALAYEARNDSIAAGLDRPKSRKVVVLR